MIGAWQFLLLAFLAALVIARLAHWRGWLSRSGALAAAVVGTLIFGLGGWPWATVLMTFFVSSSLLSRFRARAKRDAEQRYAKSHARDMLQVFANGGAGALAVLGNWVLPSPLWFAFFVGAMATANADTWATELGALSKRPPRLITTGARVAAGTSGGISPAGTLAALAGACAIGIAAGFFSWPQMGRYLLLSSASGLLGALVDSLLGATVQQIYYDDERGQETEKRYQGERPLRLVRGWRWMTNDMVNLMASVVGGLIMVWGLLCLP